MPTREEFLKQLNYYFKIISNDQLNKHEKEVYLNEKYEEYRNNGNPNKLIDDIDKKIKELENKKKHIEEYVIELKGKDERIDELYGYIKRFDDDNQRITNEMEPIKNRLTEINNIIPNNEKKIQENNKEIKELNDKLDKFDEKANSAIFKEMGSFKDEKVKEIKATFQDEAKKIKEESILKINDIEEKAKAEIDNLEKEKEKLDKEILTRVEMEEDYKRQIEICTKEMAVPLAELAKLSEADKETERYTRLTQDVGMWNNTIKTHTSENERVLKEKAGFQAEKDKLKKRINEIQVKRDQDIEAITNDSKEAYNQMDKKIDDLANKAFDDKVATLKAGYNSEKETLTNRLNILTNETNTLAKENEALTKEINPAKEAIEKLNNSLNNNNTNRQINVDKQTKYAEDLIDASLEKLKNEKKVSYQFAVLHNAMHNTNPIATKNGVINGLKVVKQAYQKYYNNGSFKRFFSFLPWTKAHKDYNDYKEIKARYMNYSNVSSQDVDNYIKESRLTGAIADAASDMSKKELDKILITDVVMNNKFEKNEDASLDDYLTGIESFHDNFLINQDKLIDVAKAQTYGLMILEQLGNIRRSTNSTRINNVIKLIEGSIINNSTEGELNNNKAKIVDIQKPAEERGNYIYNFDVVKENDNAVLINDNTTVVKDAEEIEEIEVNQALDNNDINTNSNQEVQNNVKIRDEFMDMYTAHIDEDERQYQELIEYRKAHPEEVETEEIDDVEYTDIDSNEIIK